MVDVGRSHIAIQFKRTHIIWTLSINRSSQASIIKRAPMRWVNPYGQYTQVTVVYYYI